MPITRRRRANPPDQPENNNHLAEQSEAAAEALAAEQPAESTQEGEERQAATSPTAGQPESTSVPPARAENVPPTPFAPQQATPFPTPQQPVTQLPMSIINGERAERLERLERQERGERPDYISTIEGGRRTARGELFRRPPQPPVSPPVPAAVSAPSLQAPSHEISLPLGNLLHLAYNPSYTGSEEARSALLQQLQDESKSGGRARCWSCGSLGVVYDRWNTRSKTFGEVGVAYCEICGVWSVM